LSEEETAGGKKNLGGDDLKRDKNGPDQGGVILCFKDSGRAEEQTENVCGKKKSIGAHG